MKVTGIGTRVINFLVDNLLIFLLSRLLFNRYNFQVIYWGYSAMPPCLFFAVALVIYYFLFESILKRTPGKYLSMSKVVTENSGKPNILQILIRTITRLIVIDCFFIPFLNDRTLHDYLSKTYVVEV